MLTDEQVISVKRLRDSYLKLIELVRLTACDTMEMHMVFRDIHKINNFNEKILYLLFVYIKNSEEDIIDIIEDTEIISNPIVCNFLQNGIRIDEINSDILKEYLINYGGLTDAVDFDEIDKIADDETIENCIVDYNLRHLEKENIKSVENRNKKLKRKIRRKTLYDKYQGRQ